MTEQTKATEYDPYVAETPDKQWQVDLLVALGYKPNPHFNVWDIAYNGVQVVHRWVGITEVLTDDEGRAIVDGDTVQRRVVWHGIPADWSPRGDTV